jgi:hypothetical protein
MGEEKNCFCAMVKNGGGKEFRFYTMAGNRGSKNSVSPPFFDTGENTRGGV